MGSDFGKVCKFITRLNMELPRDPKNDCRGIFTAALFTIAKR
jgi:hypothetical protein